MRVLIIGETTPALSYIFPHHAVCDEFDALYEPELVLVTTDLPFDISEIRRTHPQMPVIVLTSNTSPGFLLQAFRQGADDVVRRPFHADELLCRATAIHRRYNQLPPSSILSAGPVVIDTLKKTVTAGGEIVHLTGKEYDLLEIFLERPNRILTKEVLLDLLYEGRDEPETKIIDVFVCKLRSKIQPHQMITTIWGRGYRLDAA